MLRDVPGVSCWLLGFDWAKQQLKKSNRTNSLSLGDLLIAGSFGGICFWAVALPIDTVKSAYQLSPNPVGLLDLARSLVREKGIYHLFRAWPVAFGRGIPGSATTLAVYELVSNHLVNQ
jgi:solute carrier family 25 carnitine/acylcarnitine transporter 20/29